MKPFMSNRCERGDCSGTDCTNCQFYKPACFGIRVPRRSSERLYNLEEKLIYRGLEKDQVKLKQRNEK